MIKRILSIVLVMLMILPMVFSLVSCEKERTEEEIINDIVNSGTTALTLSIWIPTNSDTNSQEFKTQLSKVEDKINEIFRDKNLSTEIEITAVSTNEYDEKLKSHLEDIEERVAAKKGLLPSNVSKGYVNKAIKVPYGDSYMYELAYPNVLDTQIDLFLIRDYESYKELAQKENLYALDSYLSIDGGRYPDVRKMISPAVFAKYTLKNAIYAIPNNHLYTDGQYQYMLIDKDAFNSVEGMDISTITDFYSCESFIEAIGSNDAYIPFVGSLDDASGVYKFDDSGLIGSTVNATTPSNIFDVEEYNKFVTLYKKLSDKSLVKESLDDGEKAAVSFFYGTSADVKAYEENYYIIKTQKPVADSDNIFSSMFAISKYSANYDRAMRVLYILQTDSDIITLLQYGIKGEDYKLEYDEDGNERIVVSKDTPYDMQGLNIGNSYMTYKNDGATIDEWDSVKDVNYDVVIDPYLNFEINFKENATDEEKALLDSLTSSVNTLSSEILSAIKDMSYDEYVEFLEILDYDITAIEDEIVSVQAKLDEEKAKEEQDAEIITDCENKLIALNDKKDAYYSNEVVVKINSSTDLKDLVTLYNELYNKYN